MAGGAKAFYTTPIKALSNQKFHDLVAEHGRDRVGLLTGDNAVNGDAPVVVMTTEVLRNMIYARSPALAGLGVVVLDEVHFLQDAYRGSVWEEVITHLPPAVRLVCLSATVSNADELVAWLRAVRGPTESVVEHRRPVELETTYLVEDRQSDRLRWLPVLVDGRPNPEGERFDLDAPIPGRGRPRRRFATPSRLATLDLLADRGLLPAIHFVFSRAGCDDAVRSALAAGARFTTPDERRRVRAIVDDHVAGLAVEDLDVLGYGEWLSALEAGLGAHHAGLVPPFKEAVEACFLEGLLRIVYATETLALGVNLPARTVVIDKLTKFTGERHEFLTPAQFTQLTGRAGRRGLDTEGTAVVAWSPFVRFGEVAGLAGSRSFPLSSSFRPTYNMAANLVRRYEPEEAHRLLNLSFAQYQADRAVVRLETRLARREDELERQRAAATCERGDVAAYLALVDDDRRHERERRAERGDEVRAGLAALRPGDVIVVPGTAAGGRADVLSVSHRKGGAVRVRVVTAGRRVRQIGEGDLDRPPEVLATVALPEPFAPRSTAFQRQVAEALHKLPRRAGHRRGAGRSRSGGSGPGAGSTGARSHPVAGCPDRDRHLKAARRAVRLEREVDELRRRVIGHTGSLARRFDQVLALLREWSYVHDWTLTERGERLVGVFHESDLLITEALETGLFDELAPTEVAALASAFTYEHRAPGPAPEPWFPSPVLRQRWRRLEGLHRALAADEDRLGLPLTRPPDAGFMAAVHGWAAGGDLDEVLEEEEITGGDFVRNVKQLVDLLRQLGGAAADPATARAAAAGSDALFRGVVSASSVVRGDDGTAVGSGPDDDPGSDPAPTGGGA